MITKTSRALIAISHAPPEPGSRVVGWSYVADDGRVDVAEPVDLGGAEEADVDQAALQVVAEQLEHADDGRRAGHDRRVADGQRQPRRPRPEHARLVDHLELGRDGPLGEVDRDVRQADADEADALALERTRRGDDHHLGLRERGLASRDLLDRGVDGLAESSGRGDHPVRALRRPADPQAGVAAGEELLRDRVEDRSVRVRRVSLEHRLLDERQARTTPP